MTRVASSIPPGTKLADTYAILTLENYRALKLNGFDGVGRYLENLTSAEVDAAHQAGVKIFAIMTADHFDGAWGVAKARSIGLPTGTTIVMDLESDHDAASDVFAAIDQCALIINQGGYKSMLYVGCQQPLTATQLYALVNVHLYWRSASFGMPTPECGWAMFQVHGAANIRVGGVLVDISFAEPDEKWRSATWVDAA